MKKNIAVLMGGYTDESIISKKSGELVYSNLNPEKYNPYRVYILKEGWYALVDNTQHPISKEDFSFQLEGKKITFDIVFNTIHGTPGEDGFVQGYFELIGLPYTGCSFYQAAVTFNKRDCISILSKYGIPSAKSVYINRDIPFDKNQIIENIGFPFMVKPNESGSSLGISKVDNPQEFDSALKKAFAQDPNVLIESFLNGPEVSVGVINYRGEIKVLGITEIVSENAFFDYEAKYEGKSTEITPARLSDEQTRAVEEVAKKAYLSLGMSGFSRSEYILVDGVPHFIEMNTLPGLSPQSILPQQAAYSKIELSDLFDNELELALKRKSKWNA
ncbi:MAG: D-alanine--D-alanine ligase [Flavobacteriaceae bacterium]|nr:MAG: D-alanine--D-alanine ligase [Flavobacteriaceae bacterium]